MCYQKLVQPFSESDSWLQHKCHKHYSTHQDHINNQISFNWSIQTSPKSTSHLLWPYHAPEPTNHTWIRLISSNTETIWMLVFDYTNIIIQKIVIHSLLKQGEQNPTHVSEPDLKTTHLGNFLENKSWFQSQTADDSRLDLHWSCRLHQLSAVSHASHTNNQNCSCVSIKDLHRTLALFSKSWQKNYFEMTPYFINRCFAT